MTKRRAVRLLVILVTVWPITLCAAGVARADTPTPVPTPTPPGFNSNSNFSGMVDNNAALPWPLPQMPATSTLLATPTLYNATPAHATDYPGQVATATAQVAAFTGPVDAISTPVAQMAGLGPTPSGGDINTGVDFGDGDITFLAWSSALGGDMAETVGVAKEFITSMIDFFAYTPAIASLIGIYAAGLIIGAFITLLALIIQAVNWLMDFTVRLLTMFGSLK